MTGKNRKNSNYYHKDLGKILLTPLQKFPISSLSLFFSSPAITANESYTVYSGGSLTDNTINWNGWYEDGTYTAGTLLGTFTSSSLTTVSVRAMALVAADTAADPVPGAEVPDGGIRIFIIYFPFRKQTV